MSRLKPRSMMAREGVQSRAETELLSLAGRRCKALHVSRGLGRGKEYRSCQSARGEGAPRTPSCPQALTPWGPGRSCSCCTERGWGGRQPPAPPGLIRQECGQRFSNLSMRQGHLMSPGSAPMSGPAPGPLTQKVWGGT